jgi:hypothetical protein
MANAGSQTNARTRIGFIADNWPSVLVIHYSSEVLGDPPQGYSPRITSIAVVQAESGLTHSFGIHLIADRQGIPRENIHLHYETLERAMLEDFNAFVEQHQRDYWVHWHMRDIKFGFETITHRFRVLSGRAAPAIQEDRRFCLRELLTDAFGAEFASRPRLRGLMALNGGVPKSVLSAAEEGTAFENKQFLRMHESTMTKVLFLKCALSKLIDGRLITDVSRLRYRLNQFLERPIVKLIGFVAVLITLWEGGTALARYVSSIVS